jgi:transcriptional regulator with XRE-family HTH domain
MLPDYSIIGKRIKEARVKKEMTQEELAYEMNFSVAYLSRIETGRSQINLKRLAEIAEILGVTTEYLLAGSNRASRDYLKKEFSDILGKCTPEQQKFIYQIAELVVEMNVGTNV